MTWQDDRAGWVSRHAHTGSMVFADDGAACTECGQHWALTSRSWEPLRPSDDDPPGLTALLAHPKEPQCPSTLSPPTF